MSSSESNVPYVPMFPMMKDFKKKNDEVSTRKEWDDIVLKNPKQFERAMSILLREKGKTDSEIKEVITKMHQESQRRKLEKKRLHEEKWDAIFAVARTTNKPPEATVTSPIVINLEDDDDEPPVLHAISSTSRKRRLDTPNISEPSSSKKTRRDQMIKLFDEQLDKIEEELKNLQGKES